MKSRFDRRTTAALAALVLATTPAAPAGAQVAVEVVASGLSQPIAIVQDPSDPAIQYVAEQNGRIRVSRAGAVLPADYLDLRSVVLNQGEQGLLGLALAPDYATSGRVFVNFTNLSGDTVIARFVRSASDPLRADPASRFDFRWPDGRRIIEQPFSNHNGGHLAFGPDGHMYIGLGDGGSANDPFHSAQDPRSLLGKMLRVDTRVPDDDAEGYDVPPDNPFVARTDVLHEIWSFGLRNPWRWSFDDPARGGTGAMVIGDVGQNAWEEINYEPAARGGRNYGWRNREGAHDHVTGQPPFPLPLVDPIHEYSHADGRSVTGGVVYRGTRLGVEMRGRYFFADFIRSRVWSLRLTVNPSTGGATAGDLREHTTELGAAAVSPASFALDASGEIYLVSYAGTVYRLTGTEPPREGGRRRPPDTTPVGTAIRRPGRAATASNMLTTLIAGPRGACRLLDDAARQDDGDDVRAVQGLLDALVLAVARQPARTPVSVTISSTGGQLDIVVWMTGASATLVACVQR